MNNLENSSLSIRIFRMISCSFIYDVGASNAKSNLATHQRPPNQKFYFDDNNQSLNNLHKAINKKIISIQFCKHTMSFYPLWYKNILRIKSKTFNRFAENVVL